MKKEVGAKWVAYYSFGAIYKVGGSP